MKNNKENVNPLPEHSWHDGMTKMGYPVGWVFNMKDESFKFNDGTILKGLNFDPYIIDVYGNKIHYQRPLCWNLEQKMDFIDSIYNEMNCGVIVLKYNDDDKALESGYEYDVVDGKQRLHTLIEFFNNEITDKYGNHWDDLSILAQRRIKSFTPFEFFQFNEKTPDSKIRTAFLNVNHKGTPMCKEQIDFVRNIQMDPEK